MVIQQGSDVAGRDAHAITRRVLQPEQMHETIERLRVRVRSRHAQRESLNRASQGILSICREIEALLREEVARGGWTAENRLALGALDAMQQQLAMVLGDVPLEKQRLCLDHALWRAADALLLLTSNHPVGGVGLKVDCGGSGQDDSR